MGLPRKVLFWSTVPLQAILVVAGSWMQCLGKLVIDVLLEFEAWVFEE